MSLNTEGVSCVRCHAYLFPEDDIVYCPVCGAPHHRECYNQLGHCALEEFHGTDRQYDKVKAREEEQAAAEMPNTGENAEGLITCQMCHEKYDFALNACPKCGAPVVKGFGKNHTAFYSCSDYPKCDFSVWDMPTEKNCPVCGSRLLVKKGKGYLYCMNKDCSYKEDAPEKE